LAPQLFAEYLILIFNHSITQGELPQDWKKGIVIPLYKSGDRSNPVNYRPISLTSVCCKIMERLLDTRIRTELENRHIFIPQQHGFRKGFSCESQVATFFHEIAAGVDSGFQTDAIFLDFAKAFDVVPHVKLLQKFHALGLNPLYTRWIQNFLNNRSQRVKLDNCVSDPVPVTSGVPQGSVLGPLLFLIFINDIAKNLKNLNCAVRLFADDCILYTQIKTVSDCVSFQSAINLVSSWCSEWDMRLNYQKCAHVTFSTKKAPLSYNYTFSDGKPIKVAENIKYLGLHLNSRLSWDLHIKSVTKKALTALYFLKRNFYKAQQDTKSTLYKTIIRPILEYGCTVWDPHQITYIASLDRVQRKAARFAKNCYSQQVSVTELEKSLRWDALKNRRKYFRLCRFYHVCNGYGGWQELFTQIHPARRLGRLDHPFKVTVPFAKKDVYKHSFVPNTCRDWNALPKSLFDNGLPPYCKFKNLVKQ
jgi:ribonucleases P/MRP protein subunit RPP40